MGNYVTIKPISAHVKADLILENPAETTLPCTIIALCAYVGEALTATIRLDNGAVFGYIPFHKLSLSENSDFSEDMSEVHFENCPDLEMSVSYLDFQNVVFKHFGENQWKPCTYLLTIDFPNRNQLVNLVADEKGYFFIRPLHKLLVDGDVDMDFSKFKKQRDTYIVTKPKTKVE